MMHGGMMAIMRHCGMLPVATSIFLYYYGPRLGGLLISLLMFSTELEFEARRVLSPTGTVYGTQTMPLF